ncbi:hypothetical protein B0T10DRAFT_548167 [Thelonectria olida]|uniref:NACHT domain-containing protein n=1 Tax=Thelonectria olida TaxID=1576542 RepID=A0A9P9AR77_9HYPO|nr:hypothetical protein B0T10DRAFT_548167 [Thelonectria olida]
MGARLEQYRSQLNTLLLTSIREEVQSRESTHADEFKRPGNLQNMDERTRTILNSILGEVSKVNQWKAEIISAIYQQNTLFPNQVAPSMPTSGQVDFLSSKLSKQARHQWAKVQSQRLIERLRFQEMFERKARISKAHRRTFDWAYAPPDPEKASWSSFTDWLEGDSSLYWITGKPGSGKSTLMKYLFDSPRTAMHLDHWSQGADILTAGFFFWNSGTGMQMSSIGLMQTLLYECLRTRPHLVRRVFPDRWRRCELFGDDLQPWSWEELSDAFFAFCELETQSGYLAFFLDGLDEFRGKHQDLVDLVRRLSATPNVKVCASSRPWLVFEDAFKTGPNLMLQDLTIPDILNFVTDRLSCNEQFADLKVREPQYASNLEVDIAKKSSGVFLWVHLVVESLLDGLTNSDRIIDLKRRLELIPPDLDGFYNRILDSSDNFYFEHASQLFRILRKSQGSLNLLDFSFADEENPNAALEAPLRALSQSDKAHLCESAKRRINSRTKGLLDVPSLDKQKAEEEHLQVPSGLGSGRSQSPSARSGRSAMDPYRNYSSTELAWLKVEYLHRTVRDFLDKPEIWNRILGGSPLPFDPSLSLARACLLRLKDHCPDALSGIEYNMWNVAQRCVAYLADAEATTGSAYTPLRMELERLAKELDIIPRPERELDESHAVSIIREQDRKTLTMRQLDPKWLRMTAPGTTTREVLSFQDQADIYERVRAQIEQGVLQPQDENGRPLLTYALLDFEPFAILRLRLLRLLLDSGADPNQTYNAPTPVPGSTMPSKVESSPWRDLLAQMENDLRIEGPYRGLYIESWVNIVELFLNYRVDLTAVPFIDGVYFERILATWNSGKAKDMDQQLKLKGISLSSSSSRLSMSKFKSRVSRMFSHRPGKSDGNLP